MRWSVVLVALAGCSSLLGLDGVKNDDPDGDRIPYPPDNCPDVANPDQSDVDMNGVGDACQLCMATDPTDSDGDGIPDQCDGCDNRLPDNNHDGVPDACENTAPPHDEDADGIPDIHDNCPSVSNPDQTDTNDSAAVPDGVGNDCDDSMAFDRQIFDGFAEPSLLWVTVGNGWMVEGDQAVVPLAQGGAYRYAGVAHGTFRIRTHVSLPTDGDVSIVALDGAPAASQYKVMCSISSKSGQRQLVIAYRSGTNVPITISSGYTGSGSADELILEGSTAATQVSFTCRTPQATAPNIAVQTTAPMWTPGIGGAVNNPASVNDGSIAFDYFDVVTSGL